MREVAYGLKYPEAAENWVLSFGEGAQARVEWKKENAPRTPGSTGSAAFPRAAPRLRSVIRLKMNIVPDNALARSKGHDGLITARY
jgi:hypothetical protein